jgi:heme exporter protein C
MSAQDSASEKRSLALAAAIAAASGAVLGMVWVLWSARIAEVAALSAGQASAAGMAPLLIGGACVFLLVAASAGAKETELLDAANSFAGLALMLAAGVAALFLAPEEKTMRVLQRIFYFHVPSAWTAFAAFFLVFVANIAYLATRKRKWDWLGVAGAEVGLAFCTIVLVTGPIWAKPAWGIWWTWDARLTSTLVLWLLYVGYLLLRDLLSEAERRARVSAIFGIFAFLDVPLVYFSIRLWRTQHPQPVIGGGEGTGLDPAMRVVLLFCWAAMMTLLVLLVRQRYRLEELRHRVEELDLAAAARAADRVPRGGVESAR